MSERISSFTDLRVYQLACELDEKIFLATKEWPKEELYSLTDQVRRSSRSVGANLAEAWAKRRYPAHFVSKLTDADGELQETMHWLTRAKVYGYFEQMAHDDLLGLCREIGQKLGKMLKDPDAFC